MNCDACRAVAAGTLAATASLAHAHEPDGAALAWSFEPWVVAPLAVAVALYALGLARMRSRTRIVPVRRSALAAYAAACVALAAALVSPLHAAGQRSFAAHMAEHELLMLVAAPFFVASRPHGVLLWALPRGWRSPLVRAVRADAVTSVRRRFGEPVAATAMLSAVLWLWHAPQPFDLALRTTGWHVVQHVCFFASALVFWNAMLDARRRRREPMLLVGCLFVAALVSGALGALMALSQSPWYAPYRALHLTAFGFPPAQDQQIAGLIMWVPGGLVHLGAALVLLAAALGETRNRESSDAV